MQDLRLIGVHEDGVHLLLADDEGNRFRVPLDDSLRAAARRDRPRLGQLQLEIEGGLRPKDVQALIRAGLSAEEVAERAGWTVEKVHRYEVPILAEREHVAGLARQVRLRSRGSHGGASTLGARVSERLRSRELDPDATRWDSRRTEKGVWTVVVLFNAGGRQREAAWDFDPLSRTVVARDDEARWLSEDEDTQAPGPLPAPHLAALAGAGHVYDVEAEGGISPRHRGARSSEPVDLVEAMRERSAHRGRQRRGRGADVPGIDRAPEDALPLEDLARTPSSDELPPAAHGHPEDDPRAVRTAEPAGADAGSSGRPRTSTRRRRRGPEGGQTASGPGTPRADEAIGVDTEDATEDATDDGPDGDETLRSDRTRGDAPQRPGRGAARRTAETQPLPQSERPTRTPKPSAGSGTEERPGRNRPVAAAAPVQTRGDASDELDDDPPADEVSTARNRPRTPTPQPRPSTRKSGRPSVPSWDDIMFGRKGD
ncbi:septation protein SepH [Intrasporangium calvum]|uniref:Septation protein SepH n=1 Tax=Intrasporangium calvum TaxID=53358 RepID=A0ABT5GHU1_9MICO|nr:septation protein SepH [Intrasporangium calvum]MDC5697827.1 septation protein SepH [Intrasporangium calvum]